MTKRVVVWLGSSRRDIRQVGPAARHVIGKELRRVQYGLEPMDWKPVPTIGLGVKEIRVHLELEYRAIYVARFSEAVYVLHVFDKRSRKTPRRDIALAKDRMHQLQAARNRMSHR